MNEAEKAYQYFVIAVPENEEQAKAYFWARKALRPVSREQVEKVWRGEWEHKKSPYDYKIFVCTRCKKQISIQGDPLIFCPACGAPMTDEAVDIMVKRLEATRSGKERLP